MNVRSTLLKIIRLLFRYPHPQISREQALEIGREECERQGWKWEEPVAIEEGLNRWDIVTAIEYRGGNAYIKVDIMDGHIIGSVLAKW